MKFEEIELIEKVISRDDVPYWILKKQAERLLSEVKQLRKGINRHRERSMKECHYWPPWDTELYKLLED